ncbi:MAG: RhuM family protein [Bacteroidales bacterium]|nr:RhuM family protein [Bacteroidales bacterium]
MGMKNEIILYQPDEAAEHIEVRIDDKTVWLSQEQMARLFDRNRVAITQHIGNIFKEGELKKEVVCKEFLLTTHHGAIQGKTQTAKVQLYNLDVIISVGYRVKSKQGTQFRIWATHVLRDYLLKGYALNQRVDRIENNVEKLSNEVNKISLQLKTQQIPTHGIFFDGQVFDAYVFVSDIIKKAEIEIILIDNYINESTLIHLSKKKAKVKVLLYTKNISKQLALDVKKANEQYRDFDIRALTVSHDRFLIIDRKELYHIGASLKDLGKKWFAFSRMDSLVKEVLNKLDDVTA